MILIAGLGNPGQGYSTNRHNIGFLCLNYLAKQHHIIFDKKQGKARVGKGIIAGKDVILAKPQTYMNASGESVVLLIRKYQIIPDDLIVIHDDMDLPLGKIRMRKGSSSGGHKGAQSIISYLSHQDFVRIRVGIGRPETSINSGETEVVDFVLGDFSKDEETMIHEAVQRVCDSVVSLLSDGLEQAMNKYNKKAV
jgi:PTH1 family peptidyl-tRNA hydrolase